MVGGKHSYVVCFISLTCSQVYTVKNRVLKNTPRILCVGVHMYGGCCYNPKGVAVTPRGVSNISWILKIVSMAEINHSFERQCVAGTSSPIGKVVS